MALCGLGLLSAFLPWLVVDLNVFSINFSLLNFMTMNTSYASISLYFMLFGGLYLIGTVALLVWKKAFIIQLVGLIVLTIPLVLGLSDITSKGHMTLDAFFALFGMMGWGAILAWAVSLVGLMLFGPARIRTAVGKLPGFGPVIITLATHNATGSTAPVRAPIRALPPVIDGPSDHQNAMASGERFLEADDLPAALRSFGRGLGTSNNDNEEAISKVKIAIVLDRMGKEDEAALFLQEARDLDPDALSIWNDQPEKMEMRRPTLLMAAR